MIWLVLKLESFRWIRMGRISRHYDYLLMPTTEGGWLSRVYYRSFS
jgi:hypothetical protein